MRLEIPLEVLTKQFKASYSAARAAMLEARRFYAKRRAWLTIDLCEPVYEWVIEEAILRGFIDAPGFDADPLIRQAWLRALWIGDAFGHVDPQKEIGAFTMLKDAGWISDSEAALEVRGVDFQDVLARRQSDALLIEDAGLTPAPAAPATEDPATNEPGNEDGEEGEDGKEDGEEETTEGAEEK